jgi:hypothetical protein
MGADEAGTMAALTAHREVIDGLIGQRGGRMPARRATASSPSSRA